MWGMCLSLPEGSVVQQPRGYLRDRRQNGDLAPTSLMAAACYVLHGLPRNKCEWFGGGFMADRPTTLSPRSSQRKVKVLVYQTEPLFSTATVSSAGPYLPNHRVRVWTLTVQDSCKLLHLLLLACGQRASEKGGIRNQLHARCEGIITTRCYQEASHNTRACFFS